MCSLIQFPFPTSPRWLSNDARSRAVFTHKIEMSYTGIRRLPNAMLSIELKIMLHFLKTYSVNERKNCQTCSR